MDSLTTQQRRSPRSIPAKSLEDDEFHQRIIPSKRKDELIEQELWEELEDDDYEDIKPFWEEGED